MLQSVITDHVKSFPVGFVLIGPKVQLNYVKLFLCVNSDCLSVSAQWMELRFNTLAKCPHCKKM